MAAADGHQQNRQHPLSTHYSGALEVRRVDFNTEEYGRGVFATIDIPRGTLVEDAHAIRIVKKEYDEHLNKTCLEHYVYTSPNKNGDMILALGIGSLFNHADPPNLDYRIILSEQRIEYYASRNISRGEELCIYYGKAVWWLNDADKEAGEEKRRQQRASDESESEAMPFSGDFLSSV